VESTPGKGSKFTIALPLCSGAGADRTSGSKAASEQPHEVGA